VRAALIHEVGGAPEVVEVPAPTRGRGEALVRVAASALQPVDLIVASGRFYDGPPEVPFTPGLEAIGTIEEAETLSPGTRVRVEIVHPGYGVDGACSEYVVVSETPTGDGGRRQTALQVIDHAELSDDLLAALGSSGGTAWRLLETAAAAGRPAEGARVLVLGGTGVVGEILVRLLAGHGAATIVVAGRNVERLAYLCEHGAAAAVELRGQDVTTIAEELVAACGGPFDLVFDPLWGEPAAAAVDALAPQGTLVNFGGSAGARASIAGVPLRALKVNIVGYSGARSLPLERMAASEAIFAEAAAGRVEVAYEVVALDDIADAWRRQAGSPGCKLVIRP
jgi:NADPH:quinone reductase